MNHDFDLGVRIREPRPVVFERLLRIEHLSRWFCGWSRIEPRVGGKFRFGGETCIFRPPGLGWETTIDEGETLRRFAFSWPISEAQTRVSYDLEDDAEETTILRARHLGVPLADSTCGSVEDAWRMCLGNLKSITEGRSDSVRPDHEPPAPPDLRLTVLVESPQGRVFEAFADPSRLRQWAQTGSDSVRIEPHVGGRVELAWDDGPDEILEWVANRRIAMRWPRPQGDLRLAFDFEEKASGTAIYFSSEGYTDDEIPAMIHDRGRWSALFVGLKNLIEGGDPGFFA